MGRETLSFVEGSHVVDIFVIGLVSFPVVDVGLVVFAGNDRERLSEISESFLHAGFRSHGSHHDSLRMASEKSS